MPYFYNTKHKHSHAMIFPVTYSCGHIGQIDLLGTAARDPKKNAECIADESARKCQGCIDKKNAEERMAYMKAVQNDEKEYGLKPLYGSVKQIEWATKIRRTYVKRLYSLIKADCKWQVDQYVQTLPLSTEDWIAGRDHGYSYHDAWDGFLNYCYRNNI